MAESSRSTDAPLSPALALAREALAATPAGLLADFDGTLSPIVSDPARARLVDGAGAPLAQLAEQLAVVAIVTGRAALDARRMANVPGLLIAGNHGTEWLEPGAAEGVAALDVADVRRRLDELLGRLPSLEGVPIERKGLSASVHYRNAADPEVTRHRILDALGEVDSLGVELRHGRMSVELRPIGIGDKGTAVHTLVERFGLRGVVALGDDVTDLDMFLAVRELDRSGRIRGVVIGVAGGAGEVPPEVLAAADAIVDGPEAAAALLRLLAAG